MHMVCGRERVLRSLVAIFLSCTMVAAGSADAATIATVTAPDGSEAVDDGDSAFGACKEASEPNGEEAVAEDSQGEVADGAEEASAGEEDLGRDCANEEPIDSNADYN